MPKPFRGKAQQQEDGLWVARKAAEMARDMKTTKTRPGMVQRSDRRKTVYGPSGRPIAVVKVHGSGNTEHEYDNHQDAVARPDPVKISAETMLERDMDLFAGRKLPPLGFFDLELRRLKERHAANPTPETWAEYQAVKRQQVAVLRERKLRRHIAGE